MSAKKSAASQAMTSDFLFCTASDFLRQNIRLPNHYSVETQKLLFFTELVAQPREDVKKQEIHTFKVQTRLLRSALQIIHTLYLVLLQVFPARRCCRLCYSCHCCQLFSHYHYYFTQRRLGNYEARAASRSPSSALKTTSSGLLLCVKPH